MRQEQTLALVLGFGLSRAAQAFAFRAEMQRALGNHRPSTIARAGFFGAISSSCSYAASALAKTLFARDADFTAAQAFMFASAKPGGRAGHRAVAAVGWQFAAAEFSGGVLIIALLALVLPLVISAQQQQQQAARAALAGETGQDASHSHAGHGDVEPAPQPASWRRRIRSLAGWPDAAGYTISDLTMLRRELVIGFVVAGFADAAVPVSFWRSLFLTGHGFWPAAENVILGPFLAVISFVCSIGNVPLAAALWTGGITFGGTSRSCSRPHQAAAAAHLPPLLRHPADPEAASGVLGHDEHGRPGPPSTCSPGPASPPRPAPGTP